MHDGLAFHADKSTNTILESFRNSSVTSSTLKFEARMEGITFSVLKPFQASTDLKGVKLRGVRAYICKINSGQIPPKNVWLHTALSTRRLKNTDKNSM